MKTRPSSKIVNKADIIRELSKTYQGVDHFISELSQEDFVMEKNSKWSPMHHLQHLILSSKKIPSVLNMSKLKLVLMGIAVTGSRSFETLKAYYLKALDEGEQAGPEYEPEIEGDWTKEELLGNWRMIQHKFEKRIDKWSEKDLDTYLLPHPVLGKLTLREMLFFTIFHTQHHLQGMTGAKSK
jgi:hypothetical protein